MGDRAELAAIADCLFRVRRGDPGAVDALCRTLGPVVEAIVRRRTPAYARRWVDAHDVAQPILLETVQQLPHLPAHAGADELMRRVHRTATCRARDAARNHRRLRGESVVPGGPEVYAVSTPSMGPVTAEDRRRFLEELVSRLPARYASVVRLCGFEERSCVEAARILGLTPDTVRKRYEVARRELERRLAGRDHA